ncbi:TlpA family protein disulfide reductase, partial [Singulisphaera rosea]
GPEPKSALMELVGKPAPEFTMTLLDGPGKTRTVTKADLAGKVVLIDFWATWCPPCLEELPEIQKLIDSLAKDGKDVLVIAQSVDQKPRELGELRTLVEQTLTDKKVSLSSNKVGLVALDPSGTIGESFHVEAIPALVLIDAKGVVQATHVGVQTEETIRKEIQAILEGKPIPASKDHMH